MSVHSVPRAARRLLGGAVVSTVAIAAVSTFIPSVVSASEFEAKTGVIKFAPDAAKTYGFESTAELTNGTVFLTRWENGWPPRQRMTPITDATAIQASLTSAADAIEGARAFRVGSVNNLTPVGLAIMDEELFTALAGSRVEISMWARADGASPSIVV
jgi:hypothetical protein